MGFAGLAFILTIRTQRFDMMKRKRFRYTNLKPKAPFLLQWSGCQRQTRRRARIGPVSRGLQQRQVATKLCSESDGLEQVLERRFAVQLFRRSLGRSNFEGRNPPPVKPNIAHESLEKQRRRENVWTNFNDENEEVRNEISTIDLEASQEVHLSSSLCMENGFEKSLKMLSEGFQTPLQSWTPNDSDSETPRADSNGSDVLVKTSVDSMVKLQ
eukprot:767510-Hanusia_phi.AAC.6